MRVPQAEGAECVTTETKRTWSFLGLETIMRDHTLWGQRLMGGMDKVLFSLLAQFKGCILWTVENHWRNLKRVMVGSNLCSEKSLWLEGVVDGMAQLLHSSRDLVLREVGETAWVWQKGMLGGQSQYWLVWQGVQPQERGYLKWFLEAGWRCWAEKSWGVSEQAIPVLWLVPSQTLKTSIRDGN